MTSPAHPYADTPLILIGGIGRSGTTALRTSLGLHRSIHSTERENNIIQDVLAAALDNCTIPSRVYGMRVDQETYNGQFRQLLLSLLWPEPREAPTAAAARLLAYSNLQPRTAAYLADVFPESKIIWIVRNGIEVIASRMRYKGFADQPFEEHCRVWNRSMEMARWGEGSDSFLLVRHETLLTRDGVEREFGRVFEFVGLEADEGCIEGMVTERHHPTDDAAADLAERSERWWDWSEAQREVFVSLCGEAMAYFGYRIPEPSGQRIGDGGHS